MVDVVVVCKDVEYLFLVFNRCDSVWITVGWSGNLVGRDHGQSKPFTSPLNDVASPNILRMLVTEATSHAEMSSENASAPGKLEHHEQSLVSHQEYAQNSPAMSVTPDTSQAEMWPYVACAAAGSASHASTAV